ncbi:PP2C family protein-serine/threonine phosphatase [Glycomyces buryatensis]|uniref:Serine/threonine-protein phosphatase n=1 Tax=Glycomyces buryatensis TaxID=2570927 RepID=A0A4S8Q381_9ACTN|nr:PP2C family protein-serine/threonine phosphatase [Glycomyces buryatensis]THV36975.1 serine/threonine-protein phosphatase [Glycomyces buryatensis]
MERLPEMLALRQTAGLAWLRAAPLAVVIIVVPLDIVTHSLTLWAVVAATPPLAALVNGPKVTALVALAAGVAFVLLEVVDAGRIPHHPQSELITVSIIGLTSVIIAHLRDRVLAHLLSVASVAEAAQRALLPEVPKRVGRLECAAIYRAAAAKSQLGGDFFDLLDTPWGVRAVIGDVSGHGLGAVSAMAALLGSFREGALDDVDLNGLGARLERRMAMRNDDHGAWNLQFATALLMAFDPEGDSVEVRSFGHHPPLLLRDRAVEEIELDPAPPLGLLGEFNTVAPATGKRLRVGDLIVAHTDGLTEARNAYGEEYPLAKRLRARAAKQGPFANAWAAANFVTDDAVAQGHVFNDDVAVIVIGVRGA